MNNSASKNYIRGVLDGQKNASRDKNVSGVNKTAYENGYRDGQKYQTSNATRETLDKIKTV